MGLTIITAIKRNWCCWNKS